MHIASAAVAYTRALVEMMKQEIFAPFPQINKQVHKGHQTVY